MSIVAWGWGDYTHPRRFNTDFDLTTVCWLWTKFEDGDHLRAWDAAAVQAADPNGPNVNDKSSTGAYDLQEGLYLGNLGEIAAARAFSVVAELGPVGRRDFRSHSGLCVEVKSTAKSAGGVSCNARTPIKADVKAIILVWLRDARWAMLVGYCRPAVFEKHKERQAQGKGRGWWLMHRKHLSHIGRLLLAEKTLEGGKIVPLKRCDTCYAAISGMHEQCPVHERRP